MTLSNNCRSAQRLYSTTSIGARMIRFYLQRQCCFQLRCAIVRQPLAGRLRRFGREGLIVCCQEANVRLRPTRVEARNQLGAGAHVFADSDWSGTCLPISFSALDNF
jgi:hypothetical protein